jgi:putative ABC transport system permease protein
VRFALGASRARVIRDFLIESLMLAAAGCGAGLLLGSFLIRLLVRLAPASIPNIGEVGLDGQVFGLSVLLAAVTGVVFGLFPAWQVSRTGAGESIKSAERGMSGRAQGRSRVALVMAEVSMACVLLIGAALLIKSFVTVMGMDLGFQPERVLAMNVNLPQQRYGTPADRLRFFDELERRAMALPGVQSVAFANRMPLRGGWGGSVTIEGSTDTRQTDRQAVSPGYFDTLGIPLVRGRFFTANDRSGQPYVAVVNQTFARLYFPGQDPIGRRIQIVGNNWMTIVGIVSDFRRGGKTADLTPQAFIPAEQVELYPVVRLADFAVRTAGEPRQLVHAVQEQVFAIDKDQPVTNVRTLEEILTASVAERRFQTMLLIAFAGVAVLLALVGIFGVLSHSVRQRTVELGIRMALGAQRGAILGMVLKQAVLWVAGGLAIGLAGSYALSRYIATLLFGVQPHDSVVYLACAGMLALIALGAAAIPARRASRVDPMVALRYE